METIQPQNQLQNSGNKLATISLIFGFLSIIPLLGWATALVALVTGIIALVNQTTKKVFAIFGILFSIIGPLLIGPILTLLLLGKFSANLNETFTKVGTELEKQNQLEQKNIQTPPATTTTTSPELNTDGQ